MQVRGTGRPLPYANPRCNGAGARAVLIPVPPPCVGDTADPSVDGVLPPRVMATRLGAIAAVLHVAPAPAAVPAEIQEQPRARLVAARLQPVQLPVHEQLRRLVHDRPQHLRQRLVPRRPRPAATAL